MQEENDKLQTENSEFTTSKLGLEAKNIQLNLEISKQVGLQDQKQDEVNKLLLQLNRFGDLTKLENNIKSVKSELQATNEQMTEYLKDQ